MGAEELGCVRDWSKLEFEIELKLKNDNDIKAEAGEKK